MTQIKQRTYGEKVQTLNATLKSLQPTNEPSRLKTKLRFLAYRLSGFLPLKVKTFRAFKFRTEHIIKFLDSRISNAYTNAIEADAKLERRIGNLESALFTAQVGERLSSLEQGSPQYVHKALRRALRENAKLEKRVKALEQALAPAQ